MANNVLNFASWQKHLFFTGGFIVPNRKGQALSVQVVPSYISHFTFHTIHYLLTFVPNRKGQALPLQVVPSYISHFTPFTIYLHSCQIERGKPFLYWWSILHFTFHISHHSLFTIYFHSCQIERGKPFLYWRFHFTLDLRRGCLKSP